MGHLIIRRAASLRSLDVIGDAITPLITADDATGFELFDLRGPAESGPPPHAHPWDEAYYVLEGEVAVMVEGAEYLVGPGDVVNVPAGSLHAYRITSASARFLVATTPQGAAHFFADVDEHVGAMPESLPTLIEVAMRNRLSSPLFTP
jgi:quercetin dioxygenase-like cupin family protein